MLMHAYVAHTSHDVPVIYWVDVRNCPMGLHHESMGSLIFEHKFQNFVNILYQRTETSCILCILNGITNKSILFGYCTRNTIIFYGCYMNCLSFFIALLICNN